MRETDNGTVEGVQERILGKKAKVYTAKEFKEMVRKGETPSPGEVDAVTCGTFGIMSGTLGIFSIPVAGPGEFPKAESITLNGVPGTVGPCPNESLGLVDCTVNGTARSVDDPAYGGGHLFRDLVAGKAVRVKVVSEGNEYSGYVKLADIPFAKMVMTRGCFMNYTGFYNPSDGPYRTIFSCRWPMEGDMTEASVSGCGEINPVQNDPELRFLGPGSMALLNGAPAMILGTGTRSSPGKPNLSLQADMHEMKAEFMGGFTTSAGPDCLNSVAAAIPVIDGASLKAVSVLDEDVVLPLADVHDRKPVAQDRYSSVWRGTDLTITEDRSNCKRCRRCSADASCPAGATPSKGIDRTRCIQCGACVAYCVGKVFSARLGHVTVDGKEVPIRLRQSSRRKGEELCEIVKEKVENGEWRLRW